MYMILDLFTVLVKVVGGIPHQLWLSMEHHQLVNINALPHSHACFLS